MPDWLVTIHSVFRWVVLAAGLGAIALAAMSAWGGRPWDALSDRLSLLFTISMDVQLLIGIVLWVLERRWTGDPILSFLHPLAMVAAVGLAHVGRRRADRATTAPNKGTQAVLFFVLSLVVVLAAIPLYSWPV